MMNPFKKNNQLLPTASINSVYVENTLANDLFKPSKIIQTIKDFSYELNINKTLSDKDIFKEFDQRITSNNPQIRKKAYEIVDLFGRRLASIVCTLKKPSIQSKNMRKNWDDTHWEYWKNIQEITFVGGLTSPVLTQKFIEIINEELEERDITDLRVSFIEGSSNLGTLGLSSIVGDGEYLLFDFGQTFIKRAHHLKQNNCIKINTILESIPSKYLFDSYQEDDEVYKSAKLLHNFIVNTVKDTIHEVRFQGNEILISIANYVQNGVIHPSKIGYGKLALLSDNYQFLLQYDLSKQLRKDIKISLHHDTTAMSLALQEDRKGAIISLGTAFGVAFIE